MAVSTQPERASAQTVTEEPQKGGPSLLDRIISRTEELTPHLPKGVTLDGIGHIVQEMAQQNSNLRLCTTSSLTRAIARGLRSGLEIGETWHLLAFKNKELSAKHGRDIYECTGSADYKGIAALMIASGAVRAVEPHCVYEGDEFAYRYGLDAMCDHRPAHSLKRGKMQGAYVVLRLPFGGSTFLYMDLAEIEEVRQRYSMQWKRGEVPYWYAWKTVIKRIAKTMPKDKRLAKALQAIGIDDESEREAVEAFAAGVSDDVVNVPTEPDRPAHVDADGVDLGPASEWETVEEPEKVTVRLDVAMEKPFGKQKIPMGQLSNDGLHEAIEWAVKAEKKTGDAEGRLAHVIACAETILSARARGEIEEPQKEAA